MNSLNAICVFIYFILYKTGKRSILFMITGVEISGYEIIKTILILIIFINDIEYSRVKIIMLIR